MFWNAPLEKAGTWTVLPTLDHKHPPWENQAPSISGWERNLEEASRGTKYMWPTVGSRVGGDRLDRCGKYRWWGKNGCLLPLDKLKTAYIGLDLLWGKYVQRTWRGLSIKRNIRQSHQAGYLASADWSWNTAIFLGAEEGEQAVKV